MSNTITVNRSELNSLVKSFSAIQGTTVKVINTAMVDIEKGLRKDILGLYNFSTLDFSNSITDREISLSQTRVEGSITFSNIPKNLATFPYSWEWGNIPPLPKKHEGKVHSVSVRKGKIKVVYGKYRYGGFTINNGSYGMQMFERTSKQKYPIKLVFGPSVVDTIRWGIYKSPMLPSFYTVINNLPKNVAVSIQL